METKRTAKTMRRIALEKGFLTVHPTFRVISGSGFYPGMLIREIKFIDKINK